MRKGWLALLFVALTLSGCVGGDDEVQDDEPATPAAPAQPTAVALTASGNVTTVNFPAPQMVEYYVNDRGSGEPTIAINKDGVAIYPSIEFDSAVPSLARTIVFRSENGGQTWDYANPKLPIDDPILDGESQPVSLDPYVFTDPETGRLFSNDLTLACSQLSWSDDGARTWTTNSVACGIPVNDHQTLFVGPPTVKVTTPLYPNIVYYCNNQIAEVICTHSLDGGLTFVPTGTQPFLGVNTGAEGGEVGFCGGLHGHGHASFTTGFVYLGKGHCNDPWVAISEDNGLTWTRVLISGATGMSPQDGHEVSISTDSAGNVYAFWMDSDMLPRLAVSTDFGYTWGPALKVGLPQVTAAKFPSIVAGDEGRIAFLYLGTTSEDGVQTEDQMNQTWEAYVAYSYDATTADPTFLTVTAHHPEDPIMRGPCNGRCQVVNGGQYDFLDIDIHPVTGQVWVALVDNCNDHQPDEDVPACNDPAGDADSYKEARGAVGVQVGGLPLREAFDDGSYVFGALDATL